MNKSSLPLSLPLVSIIITNFNYGRFLREAIQSIDAQTYEPLEIVVVDDASTDESVMILDQISTERSDIKIVRNELNSGQTYSFYAGLKASQGNYVIFLDADDLLLPHAVATHIMVHLTSRIHAGFTSCDFIEMNGVAVMTGSSLPVPPEDMYIFHNNASGSFLRSCGDEVGGALGLAMEGFDAISSKTYFVHPNNKKYRFFAPTSGNCFRRDALELFMDEDAPMNLRLNTDAYVREGIFLLTGCTIIDIPLFAYRIHGGNGFTNSPSLFGKRNFNSGRDLSSRIIANRSMVDRLLNRSKYFLDYFGEASYVAAFRSLLFSVKASETTDYEHLTVYIEDRIKSESGLLAGEDLRQKLLELVEKKPLGPRSAFKKHVAEFFLTTGRIFHSEYLSGLGDELWNSSQVDKE